MQARFLRVFRFKAIQQHANKYFWAILILLLSELHVSNKTKKTWTWFDMNAKMTWCLVSGRHSWCLTKVKQRRACVLTRNSPWTPCSRISFPRAAQQPAQYLAFWERLTRTRQTWHCPFRPRRKSTLVSTFSVRLVPSSSGTRNRSFIWFRSRVWSHHRIEWNDTQKNGGKSSPFFHNRPKSRSIMGVRVSIGENLPRLRSCPFLRWALFVRAS